MNKNAGKVDLKLQIDWRALTNCYYAIFPVCEPENDEHIRSNVRAFIVCNNFSLPRPIVRPANPKESCFLYFAFVSRCASWLFSSSLDDAGCGWLISIEKKNINKLK